MEIKRRRFQGVLNILSFNRHFYIVGLAILLLIILAHILFTMPNIIFWFLIVSFLYGFLMPLIISAYVYDFSGYYQFHWLNKLAIDADTVKTIVNINAGFDETSFILQNKFPNAKLQVFDFYNPQKHTEPAIVRARKVSLFFPNTRQMNTSQIPIQEKEVDIVFLLSSAHEIRSNSEKLEFLKECYRICKPNGKVIMVEHLRDFPNFIAFTIGFTHFFSSKVWKKSFKASGFTKIEETKFTPFMSIFNCTP